MSTPNATTLRRGLLWPAPQWLALFYDLAFAAGVIAIASSYGEDHTALGAVWLATTYGIIASAWVLTGGATGALSARPRHVTTPVVVLIVVQMTTILMLAVASSGPIGSSDGVFDTLLAALLATCLALGWLARDGAHAIPTKSILLTIAAMLTLGASWLLPDTIGLLSWLLALTALAFAAGMVAVDRRIDMHRFAHRLGELTIIIIGEVLVKMVLTAGDESVLDVQLVSLVAALAILVAVFWIYFTGPVTVGALPGRRRLLWVPTHWALHVGLLALAVGLSKLLVGAKTLDDPANVFALLTAPALVVIAALALLDWVTRSRRWPILSVAAAGVALVAAFGLFWGLESLVLAFAVAALALLAVGIGNRGGGGGHSDVAGSDASGSPHQIVDEPVAGEAGT